MPYIATKVDANFYHIILLPSDWSLDAQLSLMCRQARANRLPTFLVWQPGSALAFDQDGQAKPARVSPQDGLFVKRAALLGHLRFYGCFAFRGERFDGFRS